MSQSSEPFVLPHGGSLVQRFVSDPTQRSEMITEAESLDRLVLSPASISDLRMIANGAFSPLTGFMGQEDYLAVLHTDHLAGGLVWTIPVCLPVISASTWMLKPGRRIALGEPGGRVLATIEVKEVFPRDKKLESEAVFGTGDETHPGVARLLAEPENLLAGDVQLLRRPADERFPDQDLDPCDSRAQFRERGWRRVVGFQTRNPIHRAHEYLLKCALEVTDGLFLHPLTGETRSGDIPADVRMRCYQELIRGYFPADRVVIGVNPAWMRFAGPKEAVFHALVRKNYGCTHFIVGRDHAGAGNFYEPLAAQQIFSRFTAEELGIIPLFFGHAFFCMRCNGMASANTCPHDASEHIALSGTSVRQLLQAGEMPPRTFTRPEVADILLEQWRQEQASG